MFGLFQLNIQNAASVVRTSIVPKQLLPHVVPIAHFNLGIDYLFSSVFVYYFATYRGNSIKTNCALFVCRLLVLFVYAPLLLYTGAYIDGSLTAIILLCRFFYVAYFAVRFHSFYFVLLNSPTLAWVFGKAWYYHFDDYTCLRGGDSYVRFGPHFVPFVSDRNLFLALRGRVQKDVCLVRRVELINGDFLYIFASEPAISVTFINDVK
ncbi:hypothetical protein ORF3 [BtNv-AlphaCoV/SC2013]|uniref:Nonstructural protein n=1 Tax=BtNv-AlphaCoV/SC2013 TaxID=1503291 RepID=A0A0U1WJW8_9ALPC|nr:hypothetical protein ORF3 [BtNv-AlphaCoV/SC2013]AIA62266.1 hypothetical protein ORF3 [BtNv-AlphaCoV/SC2013]